MTMMMIHVMPRTIIILPMLTTMNKMMMMMMMMIPMCPLLVQAEDNDYYNSNVIFNMYGPKPIYY